MILIVVSNDFLAELFRQRTNQLEIQSLSKMDLDAFSEDSDAVGDASGAEVRHRRLAHSDVSSEDEEPDRFMNEPDRFINIEVLIILQFNSQLAYHWVFYSIFSLLTQMIRFRMEKISKFLTKEIRSLTAIFS